MNPDTEPTDRAIRLLQRTRELLLDRRATAVTTRRGANWSGAASCRRGNGFEVNPEAVGHMSLRVFSRKSVALARDDAGLAYTPL